MWNKKDKDLVTREEIKGRRESIKRQIEILEAVYNPKDFNQHHQKISKLIERDEKLRLKYYCK